MLPDANHRNRIDIGISADQIAANYVGGFTALPSLELATMPQTHKENQEGLNEGYYSHCSFSSPTQALPAEINPRSGVEPSLRQVRTGPARPRQTGPLDRQMLDLVLGGASDLRRTAPQDRSGKARRIPRQRALGRTPHRRHRASPERSGPGQGGRSALSKRNESDSPPIEIKIPEGDKRSEYMQVMCDLNVLAFQTDIDARQHLHRLDPERRFLSRTGLHGTSITRVTHHNNEPDKVSKVAAITAFNIAQFAYMVKKMHSLREGDGTLLDNCIMMWGSGLEDGNKHTRENLPFIIAGKGGGSHQNGPVPGGHEGQSRRSAHHVARLYGRPTGPPFGHRNQADHGNDERGQSVKWVCRFSGEGLGRGPAARVTGPRRESRFLRTLSRCLHPMTTRRWMIVVAVVGLCSLVSLQSESDVRGFSRSPITITKEVRIVTSALFGRHRHHRINSGTRIWGGNTATPPPIPGFRSRLIRQRLR